MIGLVNAIERARGSARDQLLARAERELREMKQKPSPAAVGAALMFAGILALARGEREEARADLARAAAQLVDVASTWGYGARYLEGVLEGGALGRAKCEELREKLRVDGWQNTERALAFVVPGLHLVE
jgi:hypothetical protein